MATIPTLDSLVFTTNREPVPVGEKWGTRDARYAMATFSVPNRFQDEDRHSTINLNIDVTGAEGTAVQQAWELLAKWMSSGAEYAASMPPKG
jgi:hypothetical protein